jgi:hypothetical protein
MHLQSSNMGSQSPLTTWQISSIFVRQIIRGCITVVGLPCLHRSGPPGEAKFPSCLCSILRYWSNTLWLWLHRASRIFWRNIYLMCKSTRRCSAHTLWLHHSPKRTVQPGWNSTSCFKTHRMPVGNLQTCFSSCSHGLASNQLHFTKYPKISCKTVTMLTPKWSATVC